MGTMRRTVVHKPRPVPQVMVSGTFTDLLHHRSALIDAIHKHRLHANVMEFDSARLVDVIDSSLQMVRESAAYIGVISLKYGQTPECPRRNPDRLSITELEFNEARTLGLPILLFIMGDDHPVKKADIEKDATNEKKLNAFRERAKIAAPDSKVNRVYAVFNSPDEFRDKLGSSLAELKMHLEAGTGDALKDAAANAEHATFPHPPALCARPDYIGSHRFVGRVAELQVLTDWAQPADPTNLVLFEAIGGSGKSMLTWEWTTNPTHALAARPTNAPWTGRFWYSFYERGAVMADFCRSALAYMTAQPLESFANRKAAELKEELLTRLHTQPWLLILDGLERVLVAYHRIDATEVPDEEVNDAKDKIANRRPTDTIREEDSDLLRALAAAAPSKILLSSRLTPRVLINSSGQPVPGVKRITLAGLRPPDAEELLRSCGVEGKSENIQSFLTECCDNHPLVTGILGGLIANYLPARGSFDIWSTAADGAAALDLAALDLVQRRNHILRAALDSLPHASRQLLSTLALLADSVDYEALKAFNPHLPPEPEIVEKPDPPDEDLDWNDDLPETERVNRQSRYEAALARWQGYQREVQARAASLELLLASSKLQETVRDLEQRGLLQWEGHERRYDLHPVVRAVAAGAMSPKDLERYGQRLVDHFTAQPHRPYQYAETIEELQSGLNVVRTLIKMGRIQEAADNYVGKLCKPLLQMGQYAEVIAVSRPFFPDGWATIPSKVHHYQGLHLISDAAIAFCNAENDEAASECLVAEILDHLKRKDWGELAISLQWLSGLRTKWTNPVALEERMLAYALNLAELSGNEIAVFRSLRSHAVFLGKIGKYADADLAWDRLRRLTVSDDSSVLNAGTELEFAQYSLRKGCLSSDLLAKVERLCAASNYSAALPDLHDLRGYCLLQSGEWELAAASYAEAVRLARERGLINAHSETGLALAKHNLGQLPSGRDEAERLAQLRRPEHHILALLWLSLGDTEHAKQHALAAYREAWADGEPYVLRYALNESTQVLQQLNVIPPKLPPYNPAKANPFLWEAQVRAAIEELRAENQLMLISKDSRGPSEVLAGLPPEE